MEDNAGAQKPAKQSSAIQQNTHDELAVKLKGLREQCVELDKRELSQSREHFRETKINKYERALCQAFLHQMRKRFGIRREFLAQLCDKDIDEIDRYLFKLSRKYRACLKIFWVWVPVAGWLTFFMVLFNVNEYPVMSNYSYFRSVVKKYRGDAYFPYRKLRAMVDKNE